LDLVMTNFPVLDEIDPYVRVRASIIGSATSPP
jgi:hypothetical protein